LVWIVALCVGCVVSPVPQPPNVEPPDFTIDDVTFGTCQTCDTDSITLNAPAGTVTHPELQEEIELWVANLDAPHPIQRSSVEPDGSFEVWAVGMENHVFRVQARVPGARSTPWDVTSGGEAQPVEPISHPLDGCLSFDPAAEIDFLELERGRVLPLTLSASADCAENVVFDSIELRTSSDAFSIFEVPIWIVPGEERTMYVELTATEPGQYEEILLFNVSAPEPDRFAVTLLGRVPED